MSESSSAGASRPAPANDACRTCGHELDAHLDGGCCAILCPCGGFKGASVSPEPQRATDVCVGSGPDAIEYTPIANRLAGRRAIREAQAPLPGTSGKTCANCPHEDCWHQGTGGRVDRPCLYCPCKAFVAPGEPSGTTPATPACINCGDPRDPSLCATCLPIVRHAQLLAGGATTARTPEPFPEGELRGMATTADEYRIVEQAIRAYHAATEEPS